MSARRFTLRQNGEMLATFRVTHHLSAEHVAMVLADHAQTEAVLTGREVADVFPFSRRVIDQAVNEYLYFRGADGEQALQDHAEEWEDALPYARKNVKAVYEVEE